MPKLPFHEGALLQVGTEFPPQAKFGYIVNSLPIQVQRLLPATAWLYYLYSYKEYSTLHSMQFDHWTFGVNESEYGNTVEIQNFQKSSGSGFNGV